MLKMKYICLFLIVLLAVSNSEAIEARCLLPIDPGVCMGLIKRYAYNTGTGRCQKFIYGGCMGNDNRFKTLKECETVCHA